MLIHYGAQAFDETAMARLAVQVVHRLKEYPESTVYLSVGSCTVGEFHELKRLLDSRTYSVVFNSRPGSGDSFITVERVPHWLWEDVMDKEDADTLNQLYS
jgi:hypothetical protein